MLIGMAMFLGCCCLYYSFRVAEGWPITNVFKRVRNRLHTGASKRLPYSFHYTMVQYPERAVISFIPGIANNSRTNLLSKLSILFLLSGLDFIILY